MCPEKPISPASQRSLMPNAQNLTLNYWPLSQCNSVLVLLIRVKINNNMAHTGGKNY